MGLSLSFQVLVKLTLVQGSANLLFKIWVINSLGFEGWGESLLHIFFYLCLFVFYSFSLLFWSVEGLHQPRAMFVGFCWLCRRSLLLLPLCQAL